MRADPPCPPSDKLLHAVVQGLAIQDQSRENINIYKENVFCGIDLEFETEGTSIAPEPASYETGKCDRMLMIAIEIPILNKMSTLFNYLAYVTSHKAACRAGAFSHDGQLVATGSLDASIKILDVERMLAKSAPDEETTGRGEQQGHPVIRTLYDHTDEVSFLEFHPKEQILASGSKDCTVKLFDISKASVKKAHKVFTVINKISFWSILSESLLFFAKPI